MSPFAVDAHQHDVLCHLGGIGRRSGFKIHRSQGHPGSSPGGGTILSFVILREVKHLKHLIT